MNNPLLSDGEDLDIFDFLEEEKVHPKSSKRGKRAERHEAASHIDTGDFKFISAKGFSATRTEKD
ncbi:MAG: hypothetical protein J5985_09700 [Kiritimatiellae bacterium]|nr:hypothetical protein [Kiritimatiellia bacterium]